MSTPPLFFPPTSTEWLRRARAAAGDLGWIVATIVWRECRLGHGRRRHSRGTRPGFVKLTYARADGITPMHPRTFAVKLQALAGAGLIEIHHPSPNASRQVRVVPVPGEEHWTRPWLGQHRE
jgi:hypothetical protein